MRTPFILVAVVVALGLGVAVAFYGPLRVSTVDGDAPGVVQSQDAAATAARTEQRQSAPVAQLVAPLLERLKQEPNDPSRWALLGKSYDYLGQRKLAADAYRQALDYGNDDPAIPKALKAAEDAFMLSVLTGTPPSSTVTQQGQNGADSITVSGVVSVAEVLRSQVKPEHTVFVYAKEIGGPPMPLAVLRADASKLPLDFVLDDSTAMVAGRNLSAAASVIVTARISASGNATTQPGDLIGESDAINPRTAGPVRLTINRTVSGGT